jgi:hypothetical protein
LQQIPQEQSLQREEQQEQAQTLFSWFSLFSFSFQKFFMFLITHYIDNVDYKTFILKNRVPTPFPLRERGGHVN